MTYFLTASWILLMFLIQCGLIKSKIYHIEVKYPLIGTEAPHGSLWPMPSYIGETSSTQFYLVKEKFTIHSNLNCDIMNENIELYKDILFPPKILNYTYEVNQNLLTDLIIEIRDTKNCTNLYPELNMDESYELKIQSGIAKLQSNSVWGALRGLESFSQLTYLTHDKLLVINDSTLIKDTPRFSHRGLLIDTARHFIPINLLRKVINGMAFNKLNVLHWHIVDDQSFPLEMKTYPNLTINGRFSPAHVYTQQEIKQLIEYARLRGVRIVPEIDTPGHVEAFGRTFPQFITVCWRNGKPYQAIYSIQGKAEILNPTVEELYPVLKDIFTEIKDIFVDDYIHLGNDEVYYDCWKSNPNISQWMREKNFYRYNQLEAYYSTKLINITNQLNKKVLVWQDVYDNGVKLQKETVIQVWKDDNYKRVINKITRDGHYAILSSPWYISFLKHGYKEWFEYYTVEPLSDFTGTEEQKKLFLGGEAALWGEYVDGTNIETRLWPRASAIAERLWSPAEVNDPEEAKFRLDEHRCRLLRRGIVAAPVLNGFCGDYEFGMKNSVFDYFNKKHYFIPDSDNISRRKKRFT